jgi:hypothetical protein
MSFKQFIVEQEAKEKTKENEDKIMGAIIDFFSTHEKPNDADVHKLAQELEIDEHAFEGKIYELLSSFLNKGLRNKVAKEKLEVEDEDLLNKAIDIETEHTEKTPIGMALARLIVMDHVAELGWDYYRELIKMEAKLKK